ncbi:uncharacterized protein LOC129964175 [Argiope bruennichi]|uniref:Uncharacterized protein n=1 Tax=Argiope bruennichi TaxID=94029 RepID=A0A8T0EV53_ARGBR|nr:uncharacterized protein LOC129964175 [Argiope bruennichi]KAF8781467.1 hypothetical protein HNY73_011858 [Argiope bruennichi]
MHFILFLALQLLLGTTLVFAEEEMSMQEVQKLMCDEENKEISDVVMGCIEEVDWASALGAANECYPDMKETSADELIKYFCSHTPEELQTSEDCSREKVEEEGKTEEMEEMMQQIETCVTDKMTEDK